MIDSTEPADTEDVTMTPTQLNEVIVEKLTHLQPIFESLLEDMVQLKADLSNGKIHWKHILDKAKLGVGAVWETSAE